MKTAARGLATIVLAGSTVTAPESGAIITRSLSWPSTMTGLDSVRGRLGLEYVSMRAIASIGVARPVPPVVNMSP